MTSKQLKIGYVQHRGDGIVLIWSNKYKCYIVDGLGINKAFSKLVNAQRFFKKIVK